MQKKLALTIPPRKSSSYDNLISMAGSPTATTLQSPQLEDPTNSQKQDPFHTIREIWNDNLGAHQTQRHLQNAYDTFPTHVSRLSTTATQGMRRWIYAKATMLCAIHAIETQPKQVEIPYKTDRLPNSLDTDLFFDFDSGEPGKETVYTHTFSGTEDNSAEGSLDPSSIQSILDTLRPHIQKKETTVHLALKETTPFSHSISPTPSLYLKTTPKIGNNNIAMFIAYAMGLDHMVPPAVTVAAPQLFGDQHLGAQFHLQVPGTHLDITKNQASTEDMHKLLLLSMLLQAYDLHEENLVMGQSNLFDQFFQNEASSKDTDTARNVPVWIDTKCILPEGNQIYLYPDGSKTTPMLGYNASPMFSSAATEPFSESTKEWFLRIGRDLPEILHGVNLDESKKNAILKNLHTLLLPIRSDSEPLSPSQLLHHRMPGVGEIVQIIHTEKAQASGFAYCNVSIGSILLNMQKRLSQPPEKIATIAAQLIQPTSPAETRKMTDAITELLQKVSQKKETSTSTQINTLFRTHLQNQKAHSHS